MNKAILSGELVGLYPSEFEWVSGKPTRWAAKMQGIPNGIFREAARSKATILEVRVERLQDIGPHGAKAEGFDTLSEEKRIFFDEVDHYGVRRANFALRGFCRAWDRIYGKRPGLAWADNPWVSVTAWDMMVAI